jgi:hypothetical protein
MVGPLWQKTEVPPLARNQFKAYGHAVLRVLINPKTFADWCATHGTSPGIRKKQAHVPLTKGADRPAAAKNVINLMDALRRSVANDAEKPAKPKKGKKRVAGQGEMLLPISGKKKENREAGKSTARRKAG